jgi:hypothetical protein
MSTCRWTGRPRSEWSASNRSIAPTVGRLLISMSATSATQGPRSVLAEAIAKPNQPVPARRETLAQRRMTPIFVLLWFGWALKTGHKGGHFALFPGDCRNSQTRWRRGADLNRRDPSFRACFRPRSPPTSRCHHEWSWMVLSFHSTPVDESSGPLPMSESVVKS